MTHKPIFNQDNVNSSGRPVLHKKDRHHRAKTYQTKITDGGGNPLSKGQIRRSRKASRDVALQAKIKYEHDN